MPGWRELRARASPNDPTPPLPPTHPPFQDGVTLKALAALLTEDDGARDGGEGAYGVDDLAEE